MENSKQLEATIVKSTELINELGKHIVGYRATLLALTFARMTGIMLAAAGVGRDDAKKFLMAIAMNSYDNESESATTTKVKGDA